MDDISHYEDACLVEHCVSIDTTGRLLFYELLLLVRYGNWNGGWTVVRFCPLY